MRIIKLNGFVFTPWIDGTECECTCCNECIPADTHHYRRNDGELYCRDCMECDSPSDAELIQAFGFVNNPDN